MSSNIGNIKVKLNLDSAAYEQGIKSAVGSINMLGTALGALGIGFGAVQIKDFITDVSEISVRMDGLTNKFSAAAGGAALGANSLQFVRDEAQRLGLVFIDTADSFSGFEAAALRSGLTLDQTKTIFDDIATAATSLHLSGEKTGLVFTALEQMASKGVVSMEELRRQLGDSLPGAFEIAAKSMGVSTAQFNKMVSNGEVMSADFLPKFSKAIKEELGGSAEIAATQANASFNRYNTALFNISDTIGDGLNPALISLAVNTTAVLDSVNKDIKGFEDWAAANQTTLQGVKDLAIVLATLAVAIPTTNAVVTTLITSIRNFGVITAATNAYQIAFATMLKGDAALALIQYRAALQATTIQVKALTVAMLSNPLTWVTLILGTGATAWWAYQQNVKSTERAIEDLNAKQDQQVNKTVDAINTIKELQGVKKLDYDQTKRLDEAINYLTSKYPNYIGRLREELSLKGQISEATIEQIANETTLAKVKQINKSIEESKLRENEGFTSALNIGAGGGLGYAGIQTFDVKPNKQSEKQKQKELNQELKKISKERQAIINDLEKINEASKITGFNNTVLPGKPKKGPKEQTPYEKTKEAYAKKIAKLENEAAKKGEEVTAQQKLAIYENYFAKLKTYFASHQKEFKDFQNGETGLVKSASQEKEESSKKSLEVTLANYDLEIARAKNNADSEYNLNLDKLNTEQAQYKSGTAEYKNFETQKLQLLQSFNDKKKELENQAVIDKLEVQQREFDTEIENLNLLLIQHKINEEEKITIEQAYIDRKIQLENNAKEERLKIYKGNKDAEYNINKDTHDKITTYTQQKNQNDTKLWEEQHKNAITFQDSIASGWSNTVGELIRRNTTFADSINSVGSTILDSFASVAEQMVSEWISNHLAMIAISDLFGAKKVTTNAAVMTSNELVSISNTQVAASNGLVAASATTTAGASVTMSGAMSGLATGINTIVGPVTELAGAMALLAISSGLVAIVMPIIAVSTAVVALSSALAALGLGVLNAVMLLTAPIALAFTPISVLLAGEFGLIAAAAKIAAIATGQLAIALAAASAAAIPLVGWALAPAAATMTGAAIAAAGALVQFREKGGPVKAGQSYIVGEKRPELFIPDRSGTILPNTGTLGGTNHEYNISVVMPISTTDIKSFEGRIDDLTDRIHSNLFKGIRKRKLRPLTS